MSPLDLHVLGTPPAFVLSQDQTLPFNPSGSLPRALRFPSRFPFLPGFALLFLSSESSLSSFLLRVSLCIVFKVRSALSRGPPRASLHRIPNQNRFVKRFFSFFSNFFSARFLSVHSLLLLIFYASSPAGNRRKEQSEP